MRNIFTLVGVRGFNVNDSGYNLSSMSRGYGTMNYWVRELVKKNNIILHSVSMSAVLLPHTLGGGAAGADIHIAATIIYEGEITDPIGDPLAYFLGEPGAFRVDL